MRTFLLVYNRRSGELAVEDFAPGEDAEALSRRFKLEREYQDRPEIEVVTVGAGSLDSLKRTHGRYFRTFEDLIAG